jgi:hypothetical protein
MCGPEVPPGGTVRTDGSSTTGSLWSLPWTFSMRSSPRSIADTPTPGKSCVVRRLGAPIPRAVCGDRRGAPRTRRPERRRRAPGRARRGAPLFAVTEPRRSLGWRSWRAPASTPWPRCEILAWIGASNAPAENQFARLIKEVGVDRVLLGSDFPVRSRLQRGTAHGPPPFVPRGEARDPWRERCAAPAPVAGACATSPSGRASDMSSTYVFR